MQPQQFSIRTLLGATACCAALCFIAQHFGTSAFISGLLFIGTIVFDSLAGQNPRSNHGWHCAGSIAALFYSMAPGAMSYEGFTGPTAFGVGVLLSIAAARRGRGVPRIVACLLLTLYTALLSFAAYNLAANWEMIFDFWFGLPMTPHGPLGYRGRYPDSGHRESSRRKRPQRVGYIFAFYDNLSCMHPLCVPALFKTSTTRFCFIGTILLGLGFLLFGIVLIPAMPHFQLDVVLTQEELKDDALRNSTLATLKKVSGNQWIVWALGGVAQLVLGILGLISFSRLADQNASNGT